MVTSTTSASGPSNGHTRRPTRIRDSPEDEDDDPRPARRARTSEASEVEGESSKRKHGEGSNRVKRPSIGQVGNEDDEEEDEDEIEDEDEAVRPEGRVGLRPPLERGDDK